MIFTYFGHACFLMETNGKKILFDPFITPNPLAKDIVSVNDIEADYILISHGHEDHIADAVSIGKRTGATIVSNYEIITWLAKQGLENGHPMNHGGSWQFDFAKVKYVNAIHSSSMPDGSYGGNPGGFIVENLEGCVYFAGDTALTYDMKILGDQHHIKVALLPIGDNFTMGVEDALLASKYIKCDQIIGMHYDTFGFIEINKGEAIQKFSNEKKTLNLIEIGQSFEI